MKILIVAGGTGGHLFPGIALAEEFTIKDKITEILFVGTKRGLEQRMLSREGFPFELIDASPLRGKGVRKLPEFLINSIKGILQSIMIIKRFHPDLVIGLGGYTSAPVMVAASLMGTKTALHEQNVLPGLANRVLGKIVRLMFVSFEDSRSYFPKAKTILTGNPIRRRCVYLHPSPLPPTPFALLVLGGSLGSSQINRAMIDALPHLIAVRDTISIIHHTGDQDLNAVNEAYRREGFSAEVVPFIDEMAGAYQRAHLVICRAGATTLAELMLHHKASLLIPYPLATDHHQHLNAKVLVNCGAAQMIDPEQLTGDTLAQRILHFYHHPEQLTEMGSNAGALARPRAAQAIVEHCYKLVKGEQCLSR